MSRPQYAALLAEKTERLRRMLAPFDAPEIEVFPSAETGYRMRAEFRIWHEGSRISYAMFEPGKKAGSASLIRLERFAPAADAVNRLMPVLLEALSADSVLKERLYQCEFLTTLSGETLVCLIYHKKLDETWQAAAHALEGSLNIRIVGRSRGQKIVLSQDYVTETLTVHGETFSYRQTEGSFTQPNARICEKMLEWACDRVGHGNRDDLLELYCGNGNFTLPLSRRFGRVLATEVSKTSVAAARWGIAANRADNIALARLSAEEFAQALVGERRFRRLEEQQIELSDYRFSTILIDPPRAGVDEGSLKTVAQFDRIIYISCNPDTLCANLAALNRSHRIRAAALFDQFPHTPHIESGVFSDGKAA